MLKPFPGRVYAGVAVALAVLALAGCAQTDPLAPGAPSPSESGLAVTGTVTASPGCPGPQRAESPCPDKPVPGAPVELAANGTVVARTTTDADGRFRVTVPAGTYEITARNVRYPSRVTESITVTSPVDLALVVDSGLR